VNGASKHTISAPGGCFYEADFYADVNTMTDSKWMDFLWLAEAMFPVDEGMNHAETCPGSMVLWLKCGLLCFRCFTEVSFY
jgi:hypothetical protein